MIIGGRYEASGGMRAGGMSEAHECYDIRLNRKVILKTLRREQEKRRLADEQKALLKLRSNHVVQLLDIVSVEFAGDELPCLVLEFIEGHDLEEGQFEVGLELIQVLWQIAKGLEAIHAANVVHRDIKPDNIRMDKEGVVKIIDFGLSREVGIDNSTRSAMGYLPYLAPELLVDGRKVFSYEADVFAFGVLALALSKAGLPEWCRLRRPASPPRDLCTIHLAGLDPVVQETLQQCLSPLARDRPTMSDVLAALERPLLCGRHRARIVINGQVNEIDKNNPLSTPTLSSGGKVVSQLQINYDGFDFKVLSVTGAVYANNLLLTIGAKLPMSCVLAFQTSSNGYYHATFDVSNPEHMI